MSLRIQRAIQDGQMRLSLSYGESIGRNEIEHQNQLVQSSGKLAVNLKRRNDAE